MVHKYVQHFLFIIAKKSGLLQLVQLIIIFQSQLRVLFSVFCYIVFDISICRRQNLHVQCDSFCYLSNLSSDMLRRTILPRQNEA